MIVFLNKYTVMGQNRIVQHERKKEMVVVAYSNGCHDMDDKVLDNWQFSKCER